VDKKAWQGQTVKAAEGVKPAVSVLGKLQIKVENHYICSATSLLRQQDAGQHFINNIIKVLKA